MGAVPDDNIWGHLSDYHLWQVRFLERIFLLIMCSWLFWHVCCRFICWITLIRCILGLLWRCWVLVRYLMCCGCSCMPARLGTRRLWGITRRGKLDTSDLLYFSPFVWLCSKCLWGTFCSSTEMLVRIRNTPLMCWVCWRLSWVPTSPTPLQGG